MSFFVIGTGLFLGYLLTTIKIFGIPKSISDSYYLWETKKKGFIFNIVMMASSLCILISWLDRTPEIIQVLPFLSCGGMLMVGTASAFKEVLTKSIHFAGAFIWAIFAILWLSLMCYWTSIIIGIASGFLGWILNKFDNRTFWLEIMVVIMQLIGLFKLLS